MINRKWLGDIGLAVLLALPTAALTRPEAPAAHRHPVAAAQHLQHLQLAIGDRSSLRQRFSLSG